MSIPERARFHRRPSHAFACLAAGFAAAGLLIGLGTLSASATAVKGSSGSFTFTGSVSGTLKVPALFSPGSLLTGCTIGGIVGSSTDEGGTDTITWMNVKLDIAGKSTKLANVTLAIESGSFGHTLSLTPSSTKKSISVTFNTTYAYAWQAESGTASTSAQGQSGSLKGTLAGTNGHAGSVSIKGSWAGCTKSNI